MGEEKGGLEGWGNKDEFMCEAPMPSLGRCIPLDSVARCLERHNANGAGF